MHHRRVTQEKNKLITDIKRYVCVCVCVPYLRLTIVKPLYKDTSLSLSFPG